MLKRILIAIAALIVLLVIIIATRSSTYRVSRATTVGAPPAVVYAQIADFRRWDAWSPWAKLDPAMKVTYGGPPSGTGASYAWTGNDKVGEGKMLITAAKPDQEVDIKLDFIKPFEATSNTQFAFQPAAGGTQVTWTMSGENNFMGKAFSLFMNMDSMVGKDFEAGLAELKKLSEAEARRRADEAKKAEPAAPAVAAPVAP